MGHAEGPGKSPVQLCLERDLAPQDCVDGAVRVCAVRPVNLLCAHRMGWQPAVGGWTLMSASALHWRKRQHDVSICTAVIVFVNK